MLVVLAITVRTETIPLVIILMPRNLLFGRNAMRLIEPISLLHIRLFIHVDGLLRDLPRLSVRTHNASHVNCIKG